MLWLAGEHCPRSKLMEPTVASEEEGFWRWRTRSMCVCVCFGNDCPIFAPPANVIFFSLWQRKTGASYAGFRLLLSVTCYMLFPRNVPRLGFLNLPTSSRKLTFTWPNFCHKETVMSRDRGVITQKA